MEGLENLTQIKRNDLQDDWELKWDKGNQIKNDWWGSEIWLYKNFPRFKKAHAVTLESELLLSSNLPGRLYAALLFLDLLHPSWNHCESL